MKKKLTITLNDYDAPLFDKAVRVVCRLRSNEMSENSHRSFLLRWMIGAICSAIIRQGGMPRHLAVNLRQETQEETLQRLEKKIPDGPNASRLLPPNPWN